MSSILRADSTAEIAETAEVFRSNFCPFSARSAISAVNYSTHARVWVILWLFSGVRFLVCPQKLVDFVVSILLRCGKATVA
jgi:hypothetical protein